MPKWIAYVLACSLALNLIAEGQTMTEANYGIRVKFSWFKPLQFPDFRLTLQGQQHVEGTQPGNRPFSEDYISIHVAGAEDVLNLRWLIQPRQKGSLLFELGGRRYRLELGHSAIMGKLEGDEVVIWLLKN